MELHSAAKSGDVEAASKLLNEQELKEVDLRDNLNRTPLHLACYYGHLDMVKLLIRHQCNIEATANDKMTALHFAAQRDHLDIVTLLCQKGANPNAILSKGKKSVLHLACAKGNLKVAEYLVAMGAKLEAKNHANQTPLDLTPQNIVENMRILLESTQKKTAGLSRRQARIQLNEPTDDDGTENTVCNKVDPELSKQSETIGPDMPAKPIGPDMPAKPIGPDMPAKPIGPPAKPIGPDMPAKPIGPDMPAKPIGPDMPAKPIGPDMPAKSIGPDMPAKPIGPDMPAKPIGPDMPAKPIGPDMPAKPIGPDMPAKSIDIDTPNDTLIGPARPSSQVKVLNVLAEGNCSKKQKTLDDRLDLA
eukprot:GHVL01026844.1.p2 GENE.GHVL01026844.1~~GHVL01026844.1.p2  ORF type:complete len:360 (+),score=78.23 GHVL01026844.1:30-1109(+)